MSLIRQVWLLLVVTLTVAFLGAVGVSLSTAREYLQTQLTAKNNDTAQALALTLGQQRGDRTAIDLMLASQFDTGAYQRIELLAADGTRLSSRIAPPRSSAVPTWFVELLRIEPAIGVSQVGDGWKQIGRLEVASQVSYAYEQLWRGAQVTTGLLALLAVLTGALAWAGVRRIRQPLQAVVAQAAALTERRFVTVSEPQVPELRDVTRAMNGMVTRLKAMFDEQAGQVDQLRRRANCDELTGVSNRTHFLSRLKAVLSSEDGPAAGALLLIRLTDLQRLNRQLGHAGTDALLRDAASALIESAARHAQPEVGRLNGSDFAMLLPDIGSLREPAVDVGARLRGVLRQHGVGSSAVVGAVRWWHAAPVSSLLAAADQALARAESRGAFAVEVDDSGEGLVLGQEAWRQRIDTAILQGRVSLVEFPLVAADLSEVHRECPLRMQIDEGGEWLPAAQWLPMARRVQQMDRIDLIAVSQALSAIAADGVPRAVNISPGSLTESDFLPSLRSLLWERREAAPGLWLEMAEGGAMRQLPALRELAALAHARGARLGLEHAGHELGDAGILLEAGLDFVKLDASLIEGVADDAARREHCESIARMLHGIGLQVYAEGVGDERDATALWVCGMDGLTGPVVARLLDGRQR
ncbi:MAG: EAL domain-containing protein [Burkholderiales bacterium]|nr:EAL domain-containing protein [Burkholderiales bacterium]